MKQLGRGVLAADSLVSWKRALGRTVSRSVGRCMFCAKSFSQLELEEDGDGVSINERSDQDRRGHVLQCWLRAGAATRKPWRGEMKRHSALLSSHCSCWERDSMFIAVGCHSL
jgi:hypothetical protein